MKYTTCIPAYGRDYKSAKAVKADFDANMDFIIADAHDRYDGKPLNRQDVAGQPVTLRVRYNGLASVCMIDCSKIK